MDLMAHHSTDKFNALNGRDKRLFFITIKMLEQQKWMSDNNVHSCKDRIISIFQPLGRPPKENKTNDYEEKMVRYSGERNEIEATFGTWKRVYKANNIRGKLADTGATWTGMPLCKKRDEVPKESSSRPAFTTRFWFFQQKGCRMRIIRFSHNSQMYLFSEP